MINKFSHQKQVEKIDKIFTKCLKTSKANMIGRGWGRGSHRGCNGKKKWKWREGSPEDILDPCSLYRCFGNKEIVIRFNSLLRMGKIDLNIPFVWVRTSRELCPSRKGEQKASRPLQRTTAYLQTVFISETEKGAPIAPNTWRNKCKSLLQLDNVDFKLNL